MSNIYDRLIIKSKKFFKVKNYNQRKVGLK